MQRVMQVLAASALALSPFAAFASTIDIAEITTTDDLGYECISGEYFEEVDDAASVAFSIGKKVRLPRTCLPDPCEEALTKTELSQITGTEVILPRFQDEWNEYYARYADHCRKETTEFLAVAEDPGLPKQFWTPFQPDLTIAGTPVVPTSGFNWPVVPVTTVSTNNGTPIGTIPTTIRISPPTVFDDDDDDKTFTDVSPSPPPVDFPPDDNPTDPNPTPVPLPASWLLLVGSLGLLLKFRKTA